MADHRKIKPKAGYSEADVGKVILDYWKSSPRWDRQTLTSALAKVVNGDGNGVNKNVVFDVIIDSDVDSAMRMVWISVPTPDIKTNGNGPQDWQAYEREFRRVEGANAEKTLGTAVLFGCGR